MQRTTTLKNGDTAVEIDEKRREKPNLFAYRQ